MIKRIKIHNSNALKDPAYRFPGNYGVEKFLELFSGKLFNIYHLYGDIKSMWERLTRSVMKYFAFLARVQGKWWKNVNNFRSWWGRVETWLVLVIILVDNGKKNHVNLEFIQFSPQFPHLLTAITWTFHFIFHTLFKLHKTVKHSHKNENFSVFLHFVCADEMNVVKLFLFFSFICTWKCWCCSCLF